VWYLTEISKLLNHENKLRQIDYFKHSGEPGSEAAESGDPPFG